MSPELDCAAGPTDRESERIGQVRPVALSGAIEASADLSGVAVVGDYLVLGADEGHRLQILKRCSKPDGWTLKRRVALAKHDQETDIEAVTYGDGYLYVVGSHSFRRRVMKPEYTVRRNRERLLRVEPEQSRNSLYRLAFDAATGKVGRPERIDLSKRLRKDPLLKLFFGIPSKENGVDIEGIAFRDGRLSVGFRGPVLRGNLVPVMQFEFEHRKRYTLVFVNLNGQGIRDMVALDEGFLLLSGPVNDAPGPFCLWWWDGRDQIPGKDSTAGTPQLIGPVSTSGGAKAEGIALVAEDATGCDVLLLYETNTSAQAVSMRIDFERGG